MTNERYKQTKHFKPATKTQTAFHVVHQKDTAITGCELLILKTTKTYKGTRRRVACLTHKVRYTIHNAYPRLPGEPPMSLKARRSK